MRSWIIIATLLSATCAAMARDITRCIIEVDGTIWANGPCDFEPLSSDDGMFVVTEKAKPSAFAYITPPRDGYPADGSWNGPGLDSHAHEYLGQLRRDGACWVNERARVCAWQ